MSIIKQGTAYTRTFILVESSNHISPLLGASPTVLISKNGGAFGAVTGTVSEVGNGWYAVMLTATDTNTAGELSFHVTATGGDDSDFADQIVAWNPPIPPTPPVPCAPGEALFAGFVWFVQNVMEIQTQYLPADSPFLGIAFGIAIDIVNRQFRKMPQVYAQMVYNLGGDTLINIAPDQPGQTFFVDLRKQFNCLGFVGGVIQSSGDESTNESMVVPEQIKMFTIANLNNLKTPYGRTYIGYAQSYGTLWGLS